MENFILFILIEIFFILLPELDNIKFKMHFPYVLIKNQNRQGAPTVEPAT